jgi:hypothetical protein
MEDKGGGVSSNLRIEQNLRTFPCRHRGKFHGREDVTGSNCALEPAPSYLCHHPQNRLERCTLWRYCDRQQMPTCCRCELRESE